MPFYGSAGTQCWLKISAVHYKLKTFSACDFSASTSTIMSEYAPEPSANPKPDPNPYYTPPPSTDPSQQQQESYVNSNAYSSPMNPSEAPSQYPTSGYSSPQFVDATYNNTDPQAMYTMSTPQGLPQVYQTAHQTPPPQQSPTSYPVNWQQPQYSPPHNGQFSHESMMQGGVSPTMQGPQSPIMQYQGDMPLNNQGSQVSVSDNL